MSCLRRLLPGLLLLPVPALSATPEFRTMCEERLPAPTLQVKRAESGYSVDTGLSYLELTGMGAGLLRHGKQSVLGLTRAEMAATVEIRMARLQNEESNQECLSPQVVITIEYKPIKIYIGREFLPGSCTYREILQHEMRHVRAYQYHLPLIEASVRTHLARRFALRIRYGEQDTLGEKFKTEIYNEWLPVVDNEIRKVDAAQAKIDSAEEYNRMEKVCDGEVQKIIGSGTSETTATVREPSPPRGNRFVIGP